MGVDKNRAQRTFGIGLRKSVLASAVAAFSVPTITAAAEMAAGSNMVTEEVVVTARRRDESLSRVPIAVSVLGAEQLENSQVKSDSDLQFAVPGLTIRQTQGNNSLTYSIRGQSADTFSGSPSAVVAYINEVPLTISGASTFYDLSSIQVLKGPQGTLFGRNTTGGAVLYTTAKPTNEQEGKLTVRGGNFDLKEVEGMINVPLVDDTLLLRGAFNTIRRNGYIHNIPNGYTHGDIGRDSARVTLTWRPNEQLENTAMYSYSRIDGTNTGATYVYSVYEVGQTNNGFTLNSTADAFFGESVSPAQQQELGYYKTRHPFGADHIGEDEIFVNTTTYEINDGLRLKNIFGYSNSDTDSEQPAYGGSVVTFATRNILTGKAGNEVEVESFSNEFQISGEALSDRLNYIAGIYLQDQTIDTLWPQTYFEGGFVTTSNFRSDITTEAVYAQGTYSLIDQLRVTAGFRYTWEDVDFEQLSQGAAFGSPGQSESFEEPSWELGLEYDVSDAFFVYGKLRSSFRSGGFNGAAPVNDADATAGGNKFDQETVEDIEAGLKFDGELAGRPARGSIAVYKTVIEDVQRIEFPFVPAFAASIAATANVPEMEVQGVEVDFTYSATDALAFGFAFTYTDAEFTDSEVELFGVEYQYSPVANTPETTWSVWGAYDLVTSSEVGDITLRVEAYGQDDMYFSNTADSIAPDTEIDGYELVNARLSWNNMYGSEFSGAIFAKNLTDEEYFAGGMALAASLGHNSTAVGEPRTYGVELSYQF